ncbi:Galactoside O-acetyltransferase [Alphaproteobacteria bacterium SO-S41]|nr:Galactoside O-acetyltransferase [Alphaproteobacteria bacterium SO-S41]
MRRDHRPYWLKQLHARRSTAWARKWLHPQFDAIGEGTAFINPRQIEIIGPNIKVGRTCHINAETTRATRLCVWFAGERVGRITLGDHVLVSPGVRIISSFGIEIASNVMIASDVYISDSDWHGIYDRTSEAGQAKPITIKENAWLGLGAIVGKGVTIGRNSIVGAGSVVTRDIPDNVIAAGNPCGVVRELDPTQPMRTRADFFADLGALTNLDRLDRAISKPNTLLGYWRTLLFPRKGD